MNLYLRLFWVWLAACFKPRIRPGDTIELALRVLPGDLDVNGHMNNGRYMTVADLALVEYFTRSGFLRLALARGWKPMLGGAILSFRRGLQPFARYTLRCTLACWDERWNYMRFEFVRGGQVMAVGHTKGAAMGRQGIVASREVYEALGFDPVSPAFPASVSAWLHADRLMREAN
jgi:acyl-CoA thioesterase FadM